MSLCHGSALEEIAGNAVKVPSIDVRGLDLGTLLHLENCHRVHNFNKVEIMLHLVQSLITKAHDDGVLKIPPPILSRVYQTISRGFVNLLNAKKITDTRFPFPYAQTIVGLLFVNTILTPFMISQTIRSKVLAAIFTFIPVFGMYAINFVAGELENPFGQDSNDLPLAHFQEEMNSCLLMLLHPNTDMTASTSDRCIYVFEDLMKAMNIDENHPHFEPLHRLSDFALREEEPEGTEPDPTPAATSSKAAPSDPPQTPVAIAPQPVTPQVEQAPLLTPVPAPPLAAGNPQAPPETPLPKAPEVEAAPNSTTAAPLSPPITPKANQRLKEEEALRLEELQQEVEQRINEFYMALQRWALMMESQVKQIREMLDLLRLLSTAVTAKPEGWETAMHPI
jgi:hypothetical protein